MLKGGLLPEVFKAQQLTIAVKLYIDLVNKMEEVNYSFT